MNNDFDRGEQLTGGDKMAAFMTGRDLGDETSVGIDAVIARLGQMPRQGKAYDHMGRHGWSNPIRKDTGLLLQVLTASVNPRKVLEIGTAHGESLLNIYKGAPSAEFHTIEWLPELAEEARANFAEAGVKVTVHNGD